MILNYISFLSIFILGTFSLVLFFKKSPVKRANNYLGILFLILSACIYILNFECQAYQNMSSCLLRSYIPVDDCLFVLIGPFLYLYVMEVFGRKQRIWSWKIILQFTIIIPSLIRTIYLATRTSNERFLFFSNGSHALQWHTIVIVGLFWLQIASYFMYLYIFIRKQTAKSKTITVETIEMNLTWLKEFLLVNIILLMACIIAAYYVNNMKTIVTIGLIILNIQFLYFFFLSLWQNGVFKEHPIIVDSIPIDQNTKQIETSQEDEIQEESKLLVTEEIAKKHIATLINVMIIQKLYLQPKCSVQDLADSSNIPVRYVSNCINIILNKNVNDFINEFRVEAAKEKLHDLTTNITIEAIGSDCGFGSKKSFNAAFKKYTDLTPSDYRKKHLTK